MAVPRRLSRTEVEAVRSKLMAHQGNKCPLCGCNMKLGQRGGPALDHCHESGFIRDVLCMTCNGGEGKVKGLAMRYGGGKEGMIEWLARLSEYWHKHSTPQYPFIHPTHLTDDEKRIKKNKAAVKKRAAKKAPARKAVKR